MQLFQGALGGCHCEWRHMLQVHQTCPEVEERHPDTQSRHLSGDDDDGMMVMMTLMMMMVKTSYSVVTIAVGKIIEGN